MYRGEEIQPRINIQSDKDIDQMGKENVRECVPPVLYFVKWAAIAIRMAVLNDACQVRH